MEHDSEPVEKQETNIVIEHAIMPSPYFDKRLLDLMACPACRGPLELSEGMVNVGVPAGLVNFGAPAGLVCRACSLVYPVRDSIPVLLPEEASRYNERLK